MAGAGQAMNDALSMGVFVLGMHRSGTSCLAGMLQLAGFHAGAVSQWNVGNPRGNRENLPLNRLNMALLSESGGDWDDPPDAIRWEQRHVDSARRLLETLSHSGKPWVLKDPRTVLTLDFWLNLAPEARLLGVCRHPRAVVRSLMNRNHMGADAALALWCRYNERLLRWHDARAFPVLRFQPDGVAFTRAVEVALSRLFPTPLTDLGLTPEAMGAFFTSELVHHRPASDTGAELFDERWGLPESLREHAQALWQTLMDRVRSGAEESADASGRRQRGGSRPTGISARAPVRPDPGSGDSDRAEIERRLESEGVHGDLLERGMAALAAEGHDEGEATAWLNRWLARYPGNPKIHWALARRAWSMGESEEAIWHAAAALGEIPGWIDPLVALGNWSAATGQKDDALRDFETLEAAVNATLSRRNWDCARLYLDGGQGLSEQHSLRRTWSVGEEHIECRFHELQEHGPIRNLRIDLATRPLSVQDLEIAVMLEGDTRRQPLAVETNAVLQKAARHFFVTNSPQVRVCVDSGPGVELSSVTVSFRCRASDHAALARATQAIRERLAALQTKTDEQSAALQAQIEAREALEEQLDDRYTELGRLAQRVVVAESDLAASLAGGADMERAHARLQRQVRQFDRRFDVVRRSWSWRLGSRVVRLLMSPWTLGFGHTSLDDLEQLRREADAPDDRPDSSPSSS